MAQCLELCKRYKLTDATAWLLEKKGDFLEAFSLIKETVMLRLSNFNQAFLQVDADAGKSGGEKGEMGLQVSCASFSVAGKPLPAAKSDIRAVKLEQFRSILNYAREMLLRTSQK